ncbi:MarR family transcriptional regulator [Alkalihalobacillus oceani]|uniref:MarR family transcriptional regulator n=1 Tax=Halalkalibacter oceani TaxID=1653776 RepID=A0A9X2DRK7_9BACI|nr:MarR family transcriptional regulator [Halalkalibacter oceani]MCM3714147.1 MarR family transcriptional regulator [Halalkalibacter oceani]MCM3762499.1 MarR family transcriptional regulator [Halalkalibacter oceani]
MDQETEKLIQLFIRLHRKQLETNIRSVDHKTSESRVLYLLKKSNSRGLKVSDLSVALRVTSPFVTQQVNLLEEKGLIQRQRDAKDGRVVRIHLTEEGWVAAEEIEQNIYSIFSGLTAYLGKEDSDKLAELLTKALNYIEEQFMDKMRGKA